MANLGWHIVRCPWLIGVELCKRVVRASKMKSRECRDDETKKKRGLLRKKRSCTYFEIASFAWHSVSHLCLGLAGGNARLKYQHRSLWNVTTWRLERLEFFHLAGYENRHMDSGPGPGRGGRSRALRLTGPLLRLPSGTLVP